MVNNVRQSSGMEIIRFRVCSPPSVDRFDLLWQWQDELLLLLMIQASP